MWGAVWQLLLHVCEAGSLVVLRREQRIKRVAVDVTGRFSHEVKREREPFASHTEYSVHVHTDTGLQCLSVLLGNNLDLRESTSPTICSQVMREREREWWETLHLPGEYRDKFMARKVPRHCPLVLLVRVGWRKSKTFKSGEGREQGLSGALLHSIEILNFDINIGKVARDAWTRNVPLRKHSNSQLQISAG
jgi:hypothetical protein